jgi:hypothetical protein
MVEHHSCRLGRGIEVAEPAGGAAVEGDHHIGFAREVTGCGEQVETGELAVVGRDHERAGERRHDVATRGTQHVEEAEHRTERVTVGLT